MTIATEIGEPVHVRTLPDLLWKRFEARVPEVDLFAALNKLEAEGEISRSSGVDASIVALSTISPAPIAPALPVTESSLMAPLGAYLSTEFRKHLKVSGADHYLSKDTAYSGAKKGIWQRPDFIVVHAARLPILNRYQVDVHGFELKTEKGCTVQSVHEALSQTRATHYGTLVWNLPSGSPRESDLQEVEATCIEYGIGLVRMTPVNGHHEFGMRIAPKRKPTPDSAIESFLSERLVGEERDDLTRALGGTPS